MSLWSPMYYSSLNPGCHGNKDNSRIWSLLRSQSLVACSLGLQQLEAGLQFQARDWSQAGAVRALNPSHQPTRNQRPGTSFWPVSCAEMNFHIEQKVVKQVKCLLGGERVHVHRYTGGLRERVKPSWQFKSLLWNISSGFPWAIFFVAFFFCPHCLACGILVA